MYKEKQNIQSFTMKTKLNQTIKPTVKEMCLDKALNPELLLWPLAEDLFVLGSSQVQI